MWLMDVEGDELQEAMDATDQDGDGYLNYQEFYKLMYENTLQENRDAMGMTVHPSKV